MKRQHFLYTAIGAASFASLAGCNDTEQPPIKCEEPEQETIDREKIHWKMATSWPESLDTVYGGAEILCQRVSDMTNGWFTITPYPADKKIPTLQEAVPPLKVLDAVENGKVECGHTASYYYINQERALGFASGVPFGLNAQQQNAWLYYGGGLEEIQKIYAKYGVINFPAGNTGMQMGGWFNRELSTVKDLQGLKMRIPGFGNYVMAKLGVQVENIASNQIYQALNEKKIDAAEWIGPHDDLQLRLNEVAEYYYYPGWWEPATTFDVLVNLKEWENLPTDYQQIFKTAAFEANARMLANYNSLNRKALITLLKDPDIKLRRYPEEIMEEARKTTNALYEFNANIDKTTFGLVYKNWKTFREEEQIDLWHNFIKEENLDEFDFYRNLF